MRQLFANVALAGLFMVTSFGAYAVDDVDCNDAQAQVKKTTDQVLRADSSQVNAFIDELVSSFDFYLMSRLVVPSKCWSESRSKRKQFKSIFRTLLVRIYTDKLASSLGTIDRIGYSSCTDHSLGKKKPKPGAIVKTIVYLTGSKSVDVDYAMYYKKPKKTWQKPKWKVYNVYAAGVSLIDNYKAEFKSSCDQGGMKTVIKKVENE